MQKSLYIYHVDLNRGSPPHSRVEVPRNLHRQLEADGCHGQSIRRVYGHQEEREEGEESRYHVGLCVDAEGSPTVYRGRSDMCLGLQVTQLEYLVQEVLLPLESFDGRQTI